MIKLLLIEDDAQLLYMVRSGLEDMIGGYEVLTAVNGKEGLQQWKEQAPDIIVSDIEMPVMNGYEMVSKIRKTEKTLPIIFASGFDKPANVIHGYNVGVSNYIKKPYTPEELDAHIKAMFRRVNGEQSRDTSLQYTLGSFRFDASKSELYDVRPFSSASGRKPIISPHAVWTCLLHSCENASPETNAFPS